MKLRLRARCRGLVEITALFEEGSKEHQKITQGISKHTVAFLHGTLKDYILTSGKWTVIMSRIDNILILDPNTTLMYFQFRLLKANNEFVSWLSKHRARQGDTGTLTTPIIDEIPFSAKRNLTECLQYALQAEVYNSAPWCVSRSRV
jgi:hypothetical protein